MNDAVIKKRLKIIADLMSELKKIKADADELLEKAPVLEENVIKEKELREQVKKQKDDFTAGNSMLSALVEELRKKRQELKEHKDVLAMELVDYYKENGILEITDQDGNIKKLKFSVKLVD